MNLEELREYCLSKRSTSEDFPFDEETLVLRVLGKIFAIIPLERKPPQINLKCDPERALELREEYDGLIYGGYHMNKKHWNTVEISQLPHELIITLVDHSYELIVAKMTKKLRDQLS